MNRVMISGASSGCGKTTIVCAVLQALVNRNMKTVSFKCGPDYIDPMFHSKIIGTKSRNIDSYFMNRDICNYLLKKNSIGADISVIEGVMGYYDGLGMSDTASSYEVSRYTETPVVLVLNCRGASRSLQAVIEGFLRYKDDSKIKGIIFNQLPKSLYPAMEEYCEKRGIKALGYFPRLQNACIESRHLGLVTADEIADIKDKMNILAETAEKTIDIDGIIALSKTAGKLKYETKNFSRLSDKKEKTLRIGVAKDLAFCFYYQDNLDLLEDMGCEIVFFSPLKDSYLPPDIDGFIFGGGYPELYTHELSKNISMRNNIKTMIEGGIPVHAECGGFMYLHNTIKNLDGQCYEMVGAIDGQCYFTSKLQRFGYVELTAQKDNILSHKGEKIRAHEFHRCESTAVQDGFKASKNGKEWDCFVSQGNLLAGFPHIHYYSNPKFAENFVDKCTIYHNHKGDKNDDLYNNCNSDRLHY